MVTEELSGNHVQAFTSTHSLLQALYIICTLSVVSSMQGKTRNSFMNSPLKMDPPDASDENIMMTIGNDAILASLQARSSLTAFRAIMSQMAMLAHKQMLNLLEYVSLFG